jgi:hypothetical protein
MDNNGKMTGYQWIYPAVSSNMGSWEIPFNILDTGGFVAGLAGKIIELNG